MERNESLGQSAHRGVPASSSHHQQIATSGETSLRSVFAWIEQLFGLKESQKGKSSSSSKTARNITLSINWMSEMFGIEVKKDDLEGLGKLGDSSVYNKDGVLTEERRYEVMNNLKKVEVLPKCDLQPVRSDEFALF